MSLPVIDTPTFKMSLMSVKEPISYRPFLVKEEKLLLMAMEGGEEKDIIDTTKQIINNCLLSKNVNAEHLPLFDLQMALLKIRSKSVGDKLELMLKHPEEKNSNGESCDNASRVNMLLSNIKINVDDNHTKQIKLTDTITIEMKYPTMDAYYRLTEIENNVNASAVEELFTVVGDCIDNIYSNEETFNASDYTKEDMDNFINSLTSEQFEKLKVFFHTMPALTHDVEWTCSKCKCKEKQTLNGIGDFFL